MNTLYLNFGFSFIALFLLFFFTNQFIKAQDRPPYEIPTPAPCNYSTSSSYGNGTSWDTTRKFKKICKGGCCFWIIYHDRLSSNLVELVYETNVVGIIYQGIDCKNYSNSEILHDFRVAIYNEIFDEHPNWYPCNNWQPDDTKATLYSYTSAGCYQMDSLGLIALDINFKPIPCDNHDYCCERKIWINVQDGYVTIDTLNEQYEDYQEIAWKEGNNSDTCSSPCIADCFQPMRTKNISPCLNDSCSKVDSTLCTIKRKSITIPQCPDCKVIVDIKVRKSNYCPAGGDSTWNDMIIDNMELDCPFRIDSITANTDADCLNSLNKNSIYNYTLDYLIRNSFFSYPNPDSISTYFRIFKSSCWADFYQQAFLGFQASKIFEECAPVENCCWMRIRIKSGLDGITRTYQILSQTPIGNDCLTPYYDCNFYCAPNN